MRYIQLLHATRNKYASRSRQLVVSGAALLGIATILFAASPVAALTPEQRRNYAFEGIEFIDDPCTQGAAGSDASIIGSINGSPDAKVLHSKFHQHVIDAFFFFIKEGFSPAQSAAIVGNMMAESTESIDPTITNGIGAHGIVQWYKGRLVSMSAWVSANFGGDRDSFIGQLNYVMQELKTSKSEVLSTIKTFSTPEDAARYWNDVFEVSGDTSNTRPDNARKVFNAATQPSPAGEGWITAAGGTVVTNPSGTTSNSGCGGVGGALGALADCKTATGDTKILCEAQKYNGIFYQWGGGHNGYDNFTSQCPPSSVPAAAKASSASNPGPCATDCSGLVSIALDNAFGLKEGWNVKGIVGGGTKWTKINMTSVQPGDIVTVGDHHVEIVDHYEPKTQVMHTFGSHDTGTRTSDSSAGSGYYDQAWHWTGTGS